MFGELLVTSFKISRKFSLACGVGIILDGLVSMALFSFGLKSDFLDSYVFKKPSSVLNRHFKWSSSALKHQMSSVAFGAAPQIFVFQI